MREKLLLAALLTAVLALSCSKSEEGLSKKEAGKRYITIEAALAEVGANPSTKTAIQSDGSVFWNPGEAISIFYAQGTDGGSKFVSTNTEPVAVASFSGNIGVITGSGEVTPEQTSFWGVYPYAEDISCNGSSITMTLPSAQVSGAGTVSDGQLPTMGRSEGLRIPFYNICGGIKFTLTRSDIVKVVFSARGDETLAGTMNVGFGENNRPQINSIAGDENEITVTPQTGDAFIAGTTYYAVLPPVLLSQGVDVSFFTPTKVGTYTNSNSIQINRSGFKKLENKDSGIEFRDIVADLSSNGTANCYIVSNNGSYKFKAVKGNTNTSVGDVKGVKVLWESYGTSETITAGSLIKADVSYSNNYITFSTGKKHKRGNAVIAAYSDADCSAGNVLWSWHIWLADQPQEVIYSNSAGTMMDRNLGASSATPGDVHALGLMYQWGRKDPFMGMAAISGSTLAKSSITWPSVVTSNSSNGTIAYAVSHPTTFIKCNSSNNDWYYTGSSSSENTRWQISSKDKGLYDPCPAGWRVPDGGYSGVWAKAAGTPGFYVGGPWVSSNRGVDFGAGNGHSTSHQFGSATTIWYPGAGYLSYDSGSMSNAGNGGLYWSCTPDGDDIYCLYFNDGGGVGLTPSSYRANAFSVRCIKE